jgi:alkylated DNA repair dioxygenase AlkB
MRARQTVCFGVPYDYSGRSHDPTPMPERIAALAGHIATIAGHPFNNCLVNRYETGGNTMGFHRDSYEGLVPGSSIAIVSLGATRALAFRSEDRLRRQEIALAHGSLLLMTADTQQHWTHAVPRAWRWTAFQPDLALVRRGVLTKAGDCPSSCQHGGRCSPRYIERGLHCGRCGLRKWQCLLRDVALRD